MPDGSLTLCDLRHLRDFRVIYNVFKSDLRTVNESERPLAHANSRHTVWGRTNRNQRGSELQDFMLGSDLMVLNKGNETTF